MFGYLCALLLSSILCGILLTCSHALAYIVLLLSLCLMLRLVTLCAESLVLPSSLSFMLLLPYYLLLLISTNTFVCALS